MVNRVESLNYATGSPTVSHNSPFHVKEQILHALLIQMVKMLSNRVGASHVLYYNML